MISQRNKAKGRDGGVGIKCEKRGGLHKIVGGLEG